MADEDGLGDIPEEAEEGGDEGGGEANGDDEKVKLLEILSKGSRTLKAHRKPMKTAREQLLAQMLATGEDTIVHDGTQYTIKERTKNAKPDEILAEAARATLAVTETEIEELIQNYDLCKKEMAEKVPYLKSGPIKKAKAGKKDKSGGRKRKKKQEEEEEPTEEVPEEQAVDPEQDHDPETEPEAERPVEEEEPAPPVRIVPHKRAEHIPASRTSHKSSNKKEDVQKDWSFVPVRRSGTRSKKQVDSDVDMPPPPPDPENNKKSSSVSKAVDEAIASLPPPRVPASPRIKSSRDRKSRRSAQVPAKRKRPEPEKEPESNSSEEEALEALQEGGLRFAFGTYNRSIRPKTSETTT